MYRYLIFFAIILASCDGSNPKDGRVGNGFDRSKKTNPPFPFGKAGIDWSSIEKQNDSLKAQFTAKPIPGFENAYRMFSPEQYSSIDSLPKHLHVVDINADGRDDLIYVGPSGGEPTEIAFILNTKVGWKIVFQEYQEVIKIGFTNQKITQVFIEDPGCCASYLTFNKIYDFQFQGEGASFKLSYLSAYHSSTTFPDTYFHQPIKFEVLNDKYKLRDMPMVNDTSLMALGGDLHPGNAVAELYAGTKGLALASSKDKTGRVWWLVQIEPKFSLKKSVFYEQEQPKILSKKIGWISSRYVKKVD